jgi:membrane-bound lytic murein transglycosylase A
MFAINPFYRSSLVLLISAGLFACANPLLKPPVPASKKADCVCDKVADKPSEKPAAPIETAKPAELKIADYGLLKPAEWDEVDGLSASHAGADDLTLAWPAWLQSCTALVKKPMWKNACDTANSLNLQTNNNPDSDSVRAYFRQNFSVYKTTNVDGAESGLITGYYQPILKGSRTKSAKYPFPLYTTPPDLITVELDGLFPELKYKRVRGRVVGNKLVPYFNRAEIETDNSPIKGRELVYIDNIVDVFFLQIQGSGVVQFENGEQVMVGYADQNGHTYNSVGRLLIERGELTSANASMAGIKNWVKNNPLKFRELLNNNPSFVFFRELPSGLPGPIGALGVPILAERAVAVDPKFVPLGAPVFLSTTQPNNNKPLKRLMMAQDTGGAIKGGVRADFFWGAGSEAGAKAGAMKQIGKIWVLLPKEFVFKN